MRFLSPLTCALASLAIIAVAPGLGQNLNKPNNAQVTTQLKAQFTKADANQDMFLDKDELAKAFRGPKAKAPAQGMYDDQGKFTKTYYDAPKKYPDLVLLWAADKDNDERLSWSEYRDYQFKLLNDRQQQLQAMQRSLQSTTRSLSTASRRSNYGRHYYSRPSYTRRYSSSRSYGSRYGGYGGTNVLAMQCAIAMQQMQMMIAARNWQMMQMQAMAMYQRAYQQAMMHACSSSSAMLNGNYRPPTRQPAAYRVVQRHYNPAPAPG